MAGGVRERGYKRSDETIMQTSYCNFTNFRCVEISVAGDHRAFGLVLISVPVDAAAITPFLFPIQVSF